MRCETFIESLRLVKLENVFNPYSDRCAEYDLPKAPQLRREALHSLLEAAKQIEIDSLWIGRDLGYRGGRRTGLALTDDVHIAAHARRWDIAIERATSGPVVAERTAAAIWRMIERISQSVFLWNVFPFHPHEASDPFTNRAHSPVERVIGEEILAELILFLRPKRIIALGEHATKAACRLTNTIEVIRVRHPSYGGQNEFMLQVASLYERAKQ